MIVSFVCPGGPTPLGGVTALYEYANGLSRRGHEVHIAHGAFWGRPGVKSVGEIGWFDFAPNVEHHFGEGPISLPPADVIFGTGAAPELGLPVLLIQGFEMFPREMEREIFRTSCLKICVASWLCDVGATYGVPADQLVYVPMGIDHQSFRVTKPLDERARRVGMLYSLHRAKGWAPGFEALSRVHERHPDVAVSIFGTDQPADPIPDWATFVCDPDRNTLVSEIYNECRVFVQPSFYEGFGFTAVEAMACGCALVTTDNGGSRDYAIPNETAYVCEPGDVEGMAAGVTQLLGDDATRLRLARAGCDFVQRFRWDLGAELLEHQLERYIADPAAFQRLPVDEQDVDISTIAPPSPR